MLRWQESALAAGWIPRETKDALLDGAKAAHDCLMAPDPHEADFWGAIEALRAGITKAEPAWTPESS